MTDKEYENQTRTKMRRYVESMARDRNARTGVPQIVYRRDTVEFPYLIWYVRSETEEAPKNATIEYRYPKES